MTAISSASSMCPPQPLHAEVDAQPIQSHPNADTIDSQQAGNGGAADNDSIWGPNDPDTNSPWPQDREPYISEDGKLAFRTVVKGTSADDTIHVTYNADGSADVDVNGKNTHYSADDARNMRIDGGAGNDTITVEDHRVGFICADGPGSSLTVDGGSGDDTIVYENDTRFGGGGSVDLNGGSGDDNISGDLKGVSVDGGTGRDTVNGLPEIHIEFPRDPGFPQGPFNIPVDVAA